MHEDDLSLRLECFNVKYHAKFITALGMLFILVKVQSIFSSVFRPIGFIRNVEQISITVLSE